MKHRIKKLRETLRLTQKDLGIQLNVTESNISNMEGGRVNNLTYDSLKIMHDFYKVNLNWLIAEDGDMFLKGDMSLKKEYDIKDDKPKLALENSASYNDKYLNLLEENRDLNNEIRKLNAMVIQLQSQLIQKK